MKLLFTSAAGLAILAIGAVACSSSSSTTSGTETMAGKVTGAAAVAGGPNSGPTVPLTLKGVVATTSSFTPPNTNSTKVPLTFKTPSDGKLVITATAPDANQNPALSPNTCIISQTVHATYTVNGAESTGKFKDATGSGTATFYFRAYAPRLANGKCNTSQNAQPLASGAVDTFTASGPLTIKS